MKSSMASDDLISFRETGTSSLELPSDTYIYCITTTAKQADVRSSNFSALSLADHLVTISSDDSLTTLDPEGLKRQNAIPNTHRSVTSLKRYATNGAECTTFMTAGRDGFVRGWDLRSNNMVLELKAPNDEPLSALACDGDLQAVVAGMELLKDPPGDVSIFGWDVRMPGQLKMTYAESHNDTVTELKFVPHAETKTLLLSSGTDGLVNIFDTAIAAEEDALFQVIKSVSALQHAGILDGDIYSLGTDETLSFHAFQSPDLYTKDPEPALLGDVRDQFGCEYVIDMVNSGSKAYIATGKHSEQWLDLIPFENIAKLPRDPRDWRLSDREPKIRLTGAHGEEIVRDVFVSEGMRVIFTCGEDGTVKQWRGDTVGGGDVEMGGTSSGRKRKSERSERKEKRKKSGPVG